MLDSLTSSEKVNLLATVGTHSSFRPIGPVEVMKLLLKTITRGDQDIKATAECLELKDTSMLKKFMDLGKLPEEIWPLITWGSREGSLSFSVAAEIAKLKEQEDIKNVAEAAIKYQFTKEELRAVTQKFRRDRGKALPQVITEIVNLRPIVTHQYLYYGLIPSDIRKLCDDNEIQGYIRKGLSKLIQPPDILAVRILDGKFAICLDQHALASNPELNKHLAKDKLEEFITSLIRPYMKVLSR